ncbi:MAG: hypothetical protein IJS52_10630 [Bacilli bacterium]|nr:hypothetical protein [Bacilli bacterium]
MAYEHIILVYAKAVIAGERTLDSIKNVLLREQVAAKVEELKKAGK